MQHTSLKSEPKYLTSNSKNTGRLAKNCTNMELPQAINLNKKKNSQNYQTYIYGCWVRKDPVWPEKRKSNSYLFKLIIVILCNVYFQKEEKCLFEWRNQKSRSQSKDCRANFLAVTKDGDRLVWPTVLSILYSQCFWK